MFTSSNSEKQSFAASPDADAVAGEDGGDEAISAESFFQPRALVLRFQWSINPLRFGLQVTSQLNQKELTKIDERIFWRENKSIKRENPIQFNMN